MAEETERQRWQRNFAELLQELRVAQTGVQVLFAFLLILAFTPGFDDTDTFARSFYLVALLAAAAAAALLIGPVAYHRLLFRRDSKPLLVVQANRMALGGLMLLIVAMVAAVVLAADVMLPRPVALLVGGLLGAWFVLLWGALPLWHRRLMRGQADQRG